jgi:hypothetical protein
MALDLSGRVINGFEIDPSISEERAAVFKRVCTYYLEGVRDFDLTGSQRFVEQVFSEFNTLSPVLYFKPDQMAFIKRDSEIEIKLKNIKEKSPNSHERVKAIKLLNKIELIRQVIIKSLSALDLGLIRKIDLFRDRNETNQSLSSTDSRADIPLTLRVTYCLTTSACPHIEAVKNSILLACYDIYHHLRGKNKAGDVIIPGLNSANIFLEPGQPWDKQDMDPEILEIISRSERKKAALAVL